MCCNDVGGSQCREKRTLRIYRMYVVCCTVLHIHAGE
jgi:hypothetical protein